MNKCTPVADVDSNRAQNSAEEFQSEAKALDTRDGQHGEETSEKAPAVIGATQEKIHNSLFRIPQDPTLEPTLGIQSQNLWDFIVTVEKDLDEHNWRDLAPYLVDGRVNYFGHRKPPIADIRNDMENDARIYSSSESTYNTDTFTHEVSNEYSPHWKGPIIYDSVNVYSVVTETVGRVHRALVRLTVGYTLNDGAVGIFALVMKVLPANV